MGRKRFEYEIRGYRYAPESFRAFKGLPGQKMEQISLSGEQRRKMGYLCMTQGGKAGVAYVKHIEREREHKCGAAMQGKRPAGGASGYPACVPGMLGPARRPY